MHKGNSNNIHNKFHLTIISKQAINPNSFKINNFMHKINHSYNSFKIIAIINSLLDSNNNNKISNIRMCNSNLMLEIQAIINLCIVIVIIIMRLAKAFQT